MVKDIPGFALAHVSYTRPTNSIECKQVCPAQRLVLLRLTDYRSQLHSNIEKIMKRLLLLRSSRSAVSRHMPALAHRRRRFDLLLTRTYATTATTAKAATAHRQFIDKLKSSSPSSSYSPHVAFTILPPPPRSLPSLSVHRILATRSGDDNARWLRLACAAGAVAAAASAAAGESNGSSRAAPRERRFEDVYDLAEKAPPLGSGE